MKKLQKQINMSEQNVKRVVFGSAIACCLFAMMILCIQIYDLGTRIVYETDLNWNQQTSATCHIEQKHICAKEIILKKQTDKLDILIRTITWKNKYENSNMIVSLWKDEIGNELIKEEKFSTSDLSDQSIYNFILADLDIPAGKYIISFTSNEPNKPVALAIDRNQQGKKYIRDGNIIDNEDLKIKVLR